MLLIPIVTAVNSSISASSFITQYRFMSTAKLA